MRKIRLGKYTGFSFGFEAGSFYVDVMTPWFYTIMEFRVKWQFLRYGG
jgi:hypothetical protein